MSRVAPITPGELLKEEFLAPVLRKIRPWATRATTDDTPRRRRA